MTQNYELIVKGIRNFENKVTTVLKELRWSFMRQQPEGASDRSSWMLLPGYVKGMSSRRKSAP